VLATSFVLDHLRTWVPAYAARLGEQARSQYWRDAADVLAAWVRQDVLLPSAERAAAG
jgi:TorA maturation chaperone TorD